MQQLIAVKQETLQAVVNYLQTRPWGEVNNMIAAINDEATNVKVADKDAPGVKLPDVSVENETDEETPDTAPDVPDEE